MSWLLLLPLISELFVSKSLVSFLYYWLLASLSFHCSVIKFRFFFSPLFFFPSGVGLRLIFTVLTLLPRVTPLLPGNFIYLISSDISSPLRTWNRNEGVSMKYKNVYLVLSLFFSFFTFVALGLKLVSSSPSRIRISVSEKCSFF